MKLLDLLTSPWAVLPEQLLEMQAIYATHLRGEKIDLEAIEARLGRPLANDQQEYVMRDGGVAVLSTSGVLAPKANMFTRVSGGASTDMLRAQIDSMANDSRVRAVVLEWDSPGGAVAGVPATATAIRALAAAKPTVSVSTGQMASGAYWLGSAANAVYVEGLTDVVGSIGVVATHSYSPRAGTAQTTEITAGRYKRIATGNAPLTKEGAAYLQQQVDEIYRVFVNAVADHRGATADNVLQHMADGRVFVGQQAIDAGLVDGVATVNDLVEQIATDPGRYAARRKAVFALGALPPATAAAGAAAVAGATSEAGPVPPAATTPPIEATDMPLTREALEQEHPALFAQLRTEFTAAGAAGERDRITAVRAQSLPGHEALVEQLAMDGRTTGPEAASAVLAAERQARASAAAAHASDAPPAAPASAAPAGESGAKSKADQVAEAKAYAAANGCDFVGAMKQLGFAA